MALELGAAMPSDHKHHHNMATPEAIAEPVEVGQSGFAAIAEIVHLIMSDPEADWSRINIDRLRSHLVDMERLTIDARVETVVHADRVEFHVSGSGQTLGAARRMVTAHAIELNKEQDWVAKAETRSDEVVFIVIPAMPADVLRIKALGFFGIMAVGAHHQEHHYAIATGRLYHH